MQDKTIMCHCVVNYKQAAFIQEIAWCQYGAKPSLESILTQSLGSTSQSCHCWNDKCKHIWYRNCKLIISQLTMKLMYQPFLSSLYLSYIIDYLLYQEFCYGSMSSMACCGVVYLIFLALAGMGGWVWLYSTFCGFCIMDPLKTAGRKVCVVVCCLHLLLRLGLWVVVCVVWCVAWSDVSYEGYVVCCPHLSPRLVLCDMDYGVMWCVGYV